MSSNSKIPWTQATWNFLGGCSEISPGCENCCARRQAEWLTNLGNKKYAGLVKNHRWTGEVRFFPEELDKPRTWRKPRLIFPAFMSDIFHTKLRNKYLDAAFDVMAECDWHTFQVLTKRPAVARAYFEDWSTAHTQGMIGGKAWPLPNVSLGVTVENADYLWRIDELRRISREVGFVSFEPLIGYIPYQRLKVHLRNIDQVIIGCEKLACKRAGRYCETNYKWYCETNYKWWAAAFEIVQAADALGIAVFFKQGPIKGKVSENPAEWPEWARRREYPK